MHEETGGPRNCRTNDADQENCQMEIKKHVDEIEMHDETIKKILTILDHEIIQEAFNESDKVSEIEESQRFSQSFKDKMRTMVAKQLGEEAAERFIDSTSDMYEDHSEDRSEDHCISRFHILSGRVQNFRRWLFRAAAVLVAVLMVFTVHRVGYVQATGLPSVDTEPEAAVEYSKIGSLKEIISKLDYTNYPLKLEQINVPKKVMKGFKELDREKGSVFINIFYGDSEKHWYQYQQTTVGASSFIDTEDGDWEDTAVGQWPGAYNKKDGTGNLWWFDYNYAYQLQGSLSKEEMIDVAKSIIRVE